MSETETVKGQVRTGPAHRKLKKSHVILMCIFVGLQLLAVVFCFVKPAPLDEILNYDVTVTAEQDGQLLIDYRVRWRVKNDTKEGPLTWIQIGMANQNFEIVGYGGDADRVTKSWEYTRIDLDRSYQRDEVTDFHFTVRQGSMLCREDGGGYFYEFVPGWFPETPVRNYSFRWKIDDKSPSANTEEKEGGCFVWKGSLRMDGYRLMRVRYGAGAFSESAQTVSYQPFQKGDSGVSHRQGERIKVCVLIAAILLIPELVLLDAGFVYFRGRGFIRYGGRGGRGGGCAGGGGCACACACACAGGGRAGCSQKDFWKPKPADHPDESGKSQEKGRSDDSGLPRG